MHITTQITAKLIAMQRVRDHDHLKYLHLASVVNAIERDKGIQTGQHSRFEVSADLRIPIDVVQEDERLGDIMYHIVSEIMRTRWGMSLIADMTRQSDINQFKQLLRWTVGIIRWTIPLRV